MQNFPGRRSDHPGVGIAQHAHRDRRFGPLKQIYVNRGPHWSIHAIFVDVADDPHDCQQAQIAINISEFHCQADRILTRPARPRERLADERRVRRIRAVALVEHAPSNQAEFQATGNIPASPRRNPLPPRFCLSRNRSSNRRTIAAGVSGVLGAWSGLMSRNMPSASRHPQGRPLVAPTSRTPGICLRRSIKFL